MPPISTHLLVVDNAHIYRTPDGKYYAPSLYDNTFFNRYLAIFDKVRFIAKTKLVDRIDTGRFIQIDAPGLEIHELPWTQGLSALARRLPAVLARYRSASAGTDCAIYRVSQLESYIAYLFRDRRQPFYLEVVNDPETFVHMPTMLRWVNQFMLRVMLKHADGAAFVTERVLQEKYLPPARLSDARFERSHYSSIELKPDWMGPPRRFLSSLQTVHLAHVSNSIDNDIKGHQTAIKVVHLLKTYGVPVTLTFIGDGSFVDALKAMCQDFNVTEQVRFVGRIHDRAELLRQLRETDLFLYPTRLEGLPRAVIEAMAVGLPTLSTPIAGIPELLDAAYMFDPDDADGFASAIVRLRERPNELSAMSQHNVETASKFSKEILDERRSRFYRSLRNRAESSERRRPQ
ncbi:glycosyltransferase [Paucibacter sp. XJ19-41]|uniref:glycosyltransferase n=1 Tax=Paucibacter sp. XJ19-41 TaxID=2927824 RepID=UPI0023499385|nr:glycosyltransferase family 4 protein [Paucibacter sp. XJ19-41]MDC6166173.1 glycosyltransferase family 4 protein [Paucibacter sp. XJ19-41]